MKKKNRVLSLGLLFILIGTLSLWAQDISWDDSFGFFESDSNFERSSLSIGGSASIQTRAIVGGKAYKDYFDRDKTKDEIYTSTDLVLDIGYFGPTTELMGSLKFCNTSLKSYQEDILDELTLRLYLGDFVIEGGKMKVVWGKGDKLHVLDNFNANDFTNFIIPDYIDRRLGETMLRVVWTGPSGAQLEGIYAPSMTADRYASIGIWAPSQIGELSAITADVLWAQATKALLSGAKATELLAIVAKADEILPSTTSFDYGQAGLRFTHTVGSVDLGTSYYYGHYKQPSVDFSGYLVAKKNDALSDDSALPSLAYDRLQVFGVEAATVIKGFNLRGEAAYYLTDDRRGDDPWVRNNSLNWVLGFDVDLPINNLNLNIQNIGSYVLKNDKIGSNPLFPVEYDVNYNSDGRYSTNRLSFMLSDKMLRNKLVLSCNIVWTIEHKDLLIMPKVGYTITDNLDVTLTGMYITSKSGGEFYDFRENSFIQLGMSYVF